MRGLALDTYTLLSSLPILLEQVTHIGGRVPPPFNVLISYLPAPRNSLYLNGARLEALQGLPLLFQGQSLVIVVVRYTDGLAFSFTACEAVHPRVERLTLCCSEALAELELA